MKLFWKIFFTVIISFIILSCFTSSMISIKHIPHMETYLIEDSRILGNLVSKEVEIGYIESKWPFESLEKLSEQKSFLFWWIVKDDGNIYLSDDSSFMGTYAYDYFPQITSITEEGNIFLDHKKNYGIFYRSFGTGENKWSFWFGFSLERLSKANEDIILATITSSLFALVILGVIFYFMTKYLTKPIEALTKASKELKKGNLNYAVKPVSKDEIGELAKTFDEMRLGLKDRNDLLNSLLNTFKGKFGNLATILVRKNIQELIKKNPRIEKILPKSLGITITKAKKFQRERERAGKKA